VPDGKRVKCPRCGTPFTAPGLVEDEEERPRKKASTKKGQTAIKKAVAPKPSSKKPTPEEDDDEDAGGGIYSYAKEDKREEDKPEIEYAPDMSIKDLRGPAQAALVKPSNYMLLIGGLCCLSDIFIICVMFWPMVFSESVVDWQKVLQAHYKDDKTAAQRIEGIKEYKDLKDQDREIVREAEGDQRLWRFLAMGVFLLLLIYNGITVVGAVKVQNLESRGWGIAASIMTLLPMGAAGLSSLIGGLFYKTIGDWVLEEMNLSYSIGLAVLPYLLALTVGIWSLRTLMSQEVIDGFEYVAD
jgi:hypothetical protein